jgi:hypothetical protein
MPGAEALEHSDRLSNRALRRDFEVNMDVIDVHFDRMDFHVMHFGRPPQQPFAILALLRQPQRSLASLRGENEMVPTIPNGMTTATEHDATYSTVPRPPPQTHKDKGAIAGPLITPRSRMPYIPGASPADLRHAVKVKPSIRT